MSPDRKGVEVHRLSPEELEEIRRDRLMTVMGREASRGYSEILIDGSADEGYDPSAVVGVFPVESVSGKFTTDLVDFTREGAGEEDEYLKRVEGLTLEGSGFATDPGIQPVKGMDIETQVVEMMSLLAESISPSAVLVFCGDRPETASVHLFYPIYLPPSEALAQVKDMSAMAIEHHKS